MRQLKILLVLAVLGFVIWSHIPSAAPAVTINDSQVQVGADSGDHAIFTASDWSDIHGASVKYGYDSFGIGGQIFRQLGGRAMISFTAQGGGDIHQLALIPRDPSVMSKMHDLNLEPGDRFRITGSFLTLQSAVLDGGSLHDSPGDVGYFLLDNIERD